MSLCWSPDHCCLIGSWLLIIPNFSSLWKFPMVCPETYFCSVIDNKYSREGWKEMGVVKGLFYVQKRWVIFDTEGSSFRVKGDSEKLTGSDHQTCSCDADSEDLLRLIPRVQPWYWWYRATWAVCFLTNVVEPQLLWTHPICFTTLPNTAIS